MKSIYRVIIVLAVITFTASCDSGFDELNSPKSGTSVIDPIYVFNQAVVNSSPPAGTLNYEVGIVQQLISPNTGVLLGANFNQVNINATNQVWINYYQNVIRFTADVLKSTKDLPARKNLYNMARIIRANAFMVLTDTYGDIPYTEAGKGYTDDQILFPAYESQQAVYPKIIAELTDATNSLDAAAPIETTDALYKGVIAQWKKFGYSLLLRAGMRLSNANATLAESTVATAFGAGVITTNADNAMNRHDANFVNPLGNTLNGTEAANFYLAEPFVNALKSNDDPRLPAIAVRYVGAKAGPEQVAAIATKDPDDQYGLPVGSTDAMADTFGKTLPHSDGSDPGTRYSISQLDRNRMAKRTSPLFIVTAAQTNLLLAEAAARGWVTGTASTFFDDGVRAHMDQMASFDPGSAVSATDRDDYVAAHPLDTSTLEASIAQIAYEYWIASFLNGSEAWSHFRRTGYPVLVANPSTASAIPGKFITRLTYPVSEIQVNTANVQAAIAAQGADALDTKIWWNK